MRININKFLSAFYSSEDEVCLRVFSDKKGDGFRGKKLKSKLYSINKLFPELVSHNKNNRGVFFIVNHGGQEDKDINRINAQFFESDTLTFKEQLEEIKKFPLEPSIIVKTRKSLHVYYLIKDGKVEDFRRIQIKLANRFQGDKSCINESRVLRLPGFYHCKNEPVMVECIKFSPNILYTQEEIEKYLKNQRAESSTKKDIVKAHNPNTKGLEVVCSKCKFIKHCVEHGKDLREPYWYAMITNLAVLKSGVDRIHEYSKLYKNYSKEETQRKIEHFLRSNTSPMKCSTISEKGFKCPNRGVTCEAASPAALSFEPLESNIIIEKINELPVSEDVTENVKTSLQFIDNYLFNAEPVIGEIIIEENISKYFSLKNVKNLKDYYRKIYKEFKKNSRRGRDKFQIPKWYRVQDNGLKFMPGVLAEHLRENTSAFYSAEGFYLYKNGVYSEIKDDAASNIVRNHMNKESCTMSSIVDARDQWKIIILKELKEINPNPYILNVKNGLFNIKEKQLNAHSDKYLSTVQLKVNYNPKARCNRFIEFLGQVLDPQLIPLIQEMIGYLFVPITQAQKCFVFVGPPRTGKSTLL